MSFVVRSERPAFFSGIFWGSSLLFKQSPYDCSDLGEALAENIIGIIGVDDSMPSPTSSVDSLDTTLNPRIDSSVPPTQTPLFKAFTLRVLPVDLPTPSDTMGECSVSAYGVRGATTGSSLLEDQTNFAIYNGMKTDFKDLEKIDELDGLNFMSSY